MLRGAAPKRASLVALSLLLVLLVPLIRLSSAEEYIYDYNTTPVTLPDGRVLYKNLTILAKYSKEVFGCPQDVKDMTPPQAYDDKTGEYRYLGFDRECAVVSNQKFPNDPGSFPPGERVYIATPWKETDKCRSHGKEIPSEAWPAIFEQIRARAAALGYPAGIPPTSPGDEIYYGIASKWSEGSGLKVNLVTLFYRRGGSPENWRYETFENLNLPSLPDYAVQFKDNSLTAGAGQQVPVSVRVWNAAGSSGPILGGSVPVTVSAVFSNGSEQLLGERSYNAGSANFNQTASFMVAIPAGAVKLKAEVNKVVRGGGQDAYGFELNNNYSNNVDYLSVTVLPSGQASLRVEPPSAACKVGEDRQFRAILTEPGGKETDVTDDSRTSWDSSKTSIASVNNTGLAHARAPGVAAITARYTSAQYGQLSASATLTVTASGTPDNLSVTALELLDDKGNPAGSAVEVNKQYTFRATFKSDFNKGGWATARFYTRRESGQIRYENQSSIYMEPHGDITVSWPWGGTTEKGVALIASINYRWWDQQGAWVEELFEGERELTYEDNKAELSVSGGEPGWSRPATTSWSYPLYYNPVRTFEKEIGKEPIYGWKEVPLIRAPESRVITVLEPPRKIEEQ